MILHHKDKPLEQTHDHLVQLITDLGFNTFADAFTWKRPYPDCWSCCFQDKYYPILYSCGKGMNRLCAKVSALAEFVERMQGFFDQNFGRQGNILGEWSPNDCKMISRDALWDTLPEIMRDLCVSNAQDMPARLMCNPLIDISNRRIVHAPYELMRYAANSNGMCAGNTMEEALVQGISEIMERHALMSVYRGEAHAFPAIPVEQIEIKTPALQRLLQDIQKKQNLKVILKDASFQGRFPVVVCLLIDEDRNKYGVGIGAHPNFEIALERCLTEIYQGKTLLTKDFGNQHQLTETYCDIVNNRHYLFERLKKATHLPAYHSAFLSEQADNKRYLRFLLEKLKTLGLTVLVKNCDRFGFPSYHVYIEKLSPLMRFTGAQSCFLLSGKYRAFDFITRLHRLTDKQIRAETDWLSDQMNNWDTNLFCSYLQQLFRLAPSVSSWIDVRDLLSVLFTMAGKKRQARIVLEANVEQLPRHQFMASKMLKTFALKAMQTDNHAGDLRASMQMLRSIMPQEITSSDDDNPFAFFIIPRCQDIFNCIDCPCRSRCYLTQWIQLRRMIISKATQTDPHHTLQKCHEWIDSEVTA